MIARVLSGSERSYTFAKYRRYTILHVGLSGAWALG